MIDPKAVNLGDTILWNGFESTVVGKSQSGKLWLAYNGFEYQVKDEDILQTCTTKNTKVVSDGGPSSYYDFPSGAITLNDLLEYKGDKQWLGDSFHLSNIVKAAWRWGSKDGATQAYDARKIIYSGARLVLKYAGVKELRKTLQDMLDDPQFQEKDT